MVFDYIRIIYKLSRELVEHCDVLCDFNPATLRENMDKKMFAVLTSTSKLTMQNTTRIANPLDEAFLVRQIKIMGKVCPDVQN